MPEVAADLRSQLRDGLRHRLRPMTGRDPDQRGRSATPIELLYDLVYVIAFSAAAEQLAHRIGEGDVGSAVGAYLFVLFAVSWAWMNFTWFASAYGNDDALFRVATIVQMVGAVVLVFGLPLAFSAAAAGRSPNNMLLVAGYLVMRLPLIALWLRAARQDPAHRRSDVAYAIVIGVAQAGWVLTVVLPLPVAVIVVALVVLALAELAAPVVLERRLGRVPWNAGHIAERFSLVTIIILGEVVAATVAAVAALVDEQGWSGGAVVIAASGLVLASALWWAYFLIPSRPLLERHPERTFAWRYAHLPMFGAIAAVGAGLRLAAAAVGEEIQLSLLQIALALAVPLALVVLTIFATWSVLLRSADPTHLPLLLLSLLPLGLAVLVAGLLGGEGSFEPGTTEDTALLAAVVGLMALSAVVEVIGHERVGYRHTVRALEQQRSRAA